MFLAEFLTDFGYTPVLAPLCLALALWIARHVSIRQALLWLVCVGAVTVTTALLKAWFAGCHYDPGMVHSPSGHTSFSVIAYGGVATVLAAPAARPQKLWIAVLWALWVLGIGISRVVLHAHTPQEVLAGYAIGGTGIIFFASLYRAPSRPSGRAIAAAVLVVALLAVLPPMQVSFESQLGWLGSWFARHLPICV